MTLELPVVIIACRVLESILTPLLPGELAAQVIWTDYGMHRDTRKLNETVQDTIDAILEPSLVLLGFGLCGDGLKGVVAGRHTLLIPRADDCIPLLLGSHEAFQRQHKAVPGTFYLSEGWLQSGDHPLQLYHDYLEKYGPEDAAWIMDMQFQHYERLLFVAPTSADLDRCRPQAREIARYCERWGMRYEEVLGSDAYLRHLVKVALALDGANDDFLVIPPGGEIRQELFFRT